MSGRAAHTLVVVLKDQHLRLGESIRSRGRELRPVFRRYFGLTLFVYPHHLLVARHHPGLVGSRTIPAPSA
jgi:hypothetical protein